MSGDQFILSHQFDGFILGRSTCDGLRAAGTGEHTEVNLRQANLPGAAAGDTNIAGKGYLQATADGVPIESCNHELGRLFNACLSLLGVEAAIIPVPPCYCTEPVGMR